MSDGSGIVVGGAQATVECGAEILAAGGNAIDAVVAAAFGSAAAEPTLTSLAGGGALIFRDENGATTVCDCFADAPGRVAPEAVGEVVTLEIDFGPTTQRFHIGPGTAAVPGVLIGLCESHERWGRLPLRDVVEPACRRLRQGTVVEPAAATVTAILAPILESDPACRDQYSVAGRLLREGDVFRSSALADTLEGVGDDWRSFHADVFVPAILAGFGLDAGGVISAEDLEGYRVEFRPPLRSDYRGVGVVTQPPPAAGGVMVAGMLRLLGDAPAPRDNPATETVRWLGHAMRIVDLARGRGDPVDPRDATRFEPWRRRHARERQGPLQPTATGPGGHPATTHIDVIDGAGAAAGLTFSYGEGAGRLIGETGIIMNNLLGEEDLLPDGPQSRVPGARLSTMMAPTLLEHPDGAISVLGSGGSNRIRSALVQTITRLVDRDEPIGSVVAAPRCHLENGVLSVETFGSAAPATAELASLGARRVVEFPQPSMFFGGVHVAKRRADGSLEGAGDPRRGGACRIVAG